MSVLSLHVEAGTPALRRTLLRHLVQSRYAAASAGSPDWSLRSLEQIHEAAGNAPSIEATAAALTRLEASGLVATVLTTGGATLWNATPAGVTAFDYAFELGELAA